MLERESMKTAIVMLVAILVAQSASATSCVKRSPESSLERSSAVFVGFLAEIDQSHYQASGVVTLRFDVSYSWKGNVPDFVEVKLVDLFDLYWTPRISELYIVFAHEHKGELFTGMCDRTKPMSHALFERYALPPPKSDRNVVASWDSLSIREVVSSMMKIAEYAAKVAASDFRYVKSDSLLAEKLLTEIATEGTATRRTRAEFGLRALRK